MKRKLLFNSNAKRWNLLLRKFLNLYQRIKTGNHTTQQLQRLVNKLRNIYQHLEKIQYQVGIKLAGTGIALTMLSATSFAQDFTSIGYLTGNNIENFGSIVKQTFADIDGNSDLDLYVGYSNGSIKVFTNDGNGNFSATGNLQADGSDINIEYDSAPVFADIDGDNDLDLYVGVRYGKIKVFTNDGSGSFSAIGNMQADGIDIDLYGPSMIFPVFADIDGDSDLDLYIGGEEVYSQDKIFVYINDGIGNFSADGYMQADGFDIEINSAVPTFEDLDDDNDLDLYVGNSDGLIEIFTNDGSGNFSADGNLQADGSNINFEWSVTPEFADLDSDSDLDLYVGDYYGYIKTFTNDGSGNFSAVGNLQTNDADIDIGLLATPVFANIDGDSDLDLYVGEYDGHIKVFMKDGSEKFIPSGNLQADGLDIDVGNWSNPEFADIDGDSYLDLFVGTSDGFIKVFTNDGSGSFSDTGNLQADGFDINVGYYGGAAPVFADIDGDSDLDLYIGDDYGKINVFINDGNGNFSTSGNLQADGSVISVGSRAAPEFADIDDDNDLDLFVGNADAFIKVFTNDGNGNFSAAGNLQADGSDIELEYRTVPEFTDIDNDGDLDLCVGDYLGKISVFINGETHETFNLDVTAFLQGAFLGSEMNPSLNSTGVLPLTQPYNEVPWDYNGEEEVASIPNIDIVDWVLVELRESAGDVTTATESTIIAESATFILQDGNIVGLDGLSKLSYDISITQNLYVVIKHRNHLGVISTYPLINSNDTYSYDFTTAANNAFGGELSQIEVVPGVWSMIAGNGDGNDQIDNKDKNEVWLLENNSSGYFSGDYDMNSQINEVDNTIMWKPNSGKGGLIP